MTNQKLYVALTDLATGDRVVVDLLRLVKAEDKGEKGCDLFLSGLKKAHGYVAVRESLDEVMRGFDALKGKEQW